MNVKHRQVRSSYWLTFQSYLSSDKAHSHLSRFNLKDIAKKNLSECIIYSPRCISRENVHPLHHLRVLNSKKVQNDKVQNLHENVGKVLEVNVSNTRKEIGQSIGAKWS